MTDLNILDQANAIAAAALEIIVRWGTYTGNNSNCKEVRTNAGTIQLQGDVIRISAHFHSSSSDWVTLHGSQIADEHFVVTGFNVKYIEGDLDYAETRIITLSQYLASEPFISGKKASISLMKGIAKAVKGE